MIQWYAGSGSGGMWSLVEIIRDLSISLTQVGIFTILGVGFMPINIFMRKASNPHCCKCDKGGQLI